MTTTEELPSVGNPSIDVTLKLLAGYNQDYSRLQTVLAAQSGDRDEAVKSLIKVSDNPQIVKMRTQVEDLVAKMRELASKELDKNKLSDTDREAKQKEADALKDRIKAARGAITNAGVAFGVDAEVISKALTQLGDPTGGRGRKPGAQGATGPRASVSVKVSAEHLNSEHTHEGFSKAAQVHGGDTVDWQTAYAQAAGVELNDISKVKDSQKFDVTIGDKTFHVETTPKERKNSSK